MSDLGNWPLSKITPDLIRQLEGAFTNGRTVKIAAGKAEIPPGILRRWLDIGKDIFEETGERLEPAAELYVRCEKARSRFIGNLQDQLTSAGAGKDSSPGSAGWQLERLERDDFGSTTKLEVSGPDGGPLMLDTGRPVVALADVIAFARTIGASARLGLDAGDSQRGLPAAREVLPDPPADQRSAERVPSE